MNTAKQKLIIKFFFGEMEDFETRPATGRGLIEVAERFLACRTTGINKANEAIDIYVLPADAAPGTLFNYGQISKADLLYIAESKSFNDVGTSSKLSIANGIVRKAREDAEYEIEEARQRAVEEARKSVKA